MGAAIEDLHGDDQPDVVFANVSGVTISHRPSNGDAARSVEGDVTAWARCLDETRSIPLEEVSKGKLKEGVYDLVITDEAGRRTFELWNKWNLLGPDGAHYHNNCAYPLARRVVPPPEGGKPSDTGAK